MSATITGAGSAARLRGQLRRHDPDPPQDPKAPGRSRLAGARTRRGGMRVLEIRYQVGGEECPSAARCRATRPRSPADGSRAWRDPRSAERQAQVAPGLGRPPYVLAGGSAEYAANHEGRHRRVVDDEYRAAAQTDEGVRNDPQPSFGRSTLVLGAIAQDRPFGLVSACRIRLSENGRAPSAAREIQLVARGSRRHVGEAVVGDEVLLRPALEQMPVPGAVRARESHLEPADRADVEVVCLAVGCPLRANSLCSMAISCRGSLSESKPVSLSWK